MQTPDQFLTSLLTLSAQGALLAMLILVVRTLLGRRLSPRWQYALWLVVVARLLLPAAGPPTSFSLKNLLNQAGMAGSGSPGAKAWIGTGGSPLPSFAPASSPDHASGPRWQCVLYDQGKETRHERRPREASVQNP